MTEPEKEATKQQEKFFWNLSLKENAKGVLEAALALCAVAFFAAYLGFAVRVLVECVQWGYNLL